MDNLPNWKDITTRFGAAYDLFGNGKTAIRGSISKYLQSMGAGIAQSAAGTIASVNSTTRTWTDVNGNFVPEENELGPANPNFGKAIITTTWDPSLVSGWGKRGYSWEVQGGISHELVQGFALDVSYTRHWYGNFWATKNQLVSPSDYSPFCVTAPVDARLPGGGGNQMCGFYDINPNKFGVVQNIVANADNFGNMADVYNGVDVAMNVRLRAGITVRGGTSTGREVIDQCDVSAKVNNAPGDLANNAGITGSLGGLNSSLVASPSTLYCRISPPFQTRLKFLAVVPLPWAGWTVSGAFQSVPGPQVLATYAATNAQVMPTLGRPLSGAASVTTVQLISPGSMYGDRLNQLDLRLAKTFQVHRYRIQPSVDLYNALNSSAVLSQNNTYGAAWLTPTQVLTARFLKVTAQISF
jgi:hypothetical protein